MARHVAAPRCARIMTAPSPLYNRDVPLMPDTRYSFGTAAAGGRIYVIGGQSIDPGPCPCRGWEIVNSLLEYDPVRDRWDTMTPMADPRWRLAAVGVGPNVYAIGGWSPGLIRSTTGSKRMTSPGISGL